MASSINASTSGAGGLISTADSSGVLNIQTAGTTAISVDASQAVTLTNALPVASGGTGAATLTANNVLLGNGTSAVQAVAPGTSGNVLTSNGTTWTSTALPAGGVTSLNGQTGAITNTDQYAIGSYVWGRPKNGTNYAINSTVAGSSLYTVTGNVEYVTAAVNNFAKIKDGATSGFTQTLVNTGTWRAMSAAEGTATYFGCGLWVRIS
jgi:hypothetical protein